MDQQASLVIHVDMKSSSFSEYPWSASTSGLIVCYVQFFTLASNSVMKPSWNGTGNGKNFSSIGQGIKRHWFHFPSYNSNYIYVQSSINTKENQIMYFSPLWSLETMYLVWDNRWRLFSCSLFLKFKVV